MREVIEAKASTPASLRPICAADFEAALPKCRPSTVSAPHAVAVCRECGTRDVVRTRAALCVVRQVAGALLEKLKAWNGAFGDDGKADAVDTGRPDMYM